ncbi:MAG: hypothetical protein Q4F18_07370 [Clostridia bacterium]|nr:hypothetical protein [Clostridia bacterium]
MKIMKRALAAALAMLFLPTAGLAQEYYTLPEIREQAAEGWHETYTDKYGRTRQVDIDIEVFGEETAPVIKACWGKPDEYYFRGGVDPSFSGIEAKEKGKGVTIAPYKYVRGMKVDVNQKYAEEYGNDLTVGEMYAFIQELMQEQGIEQKYTWERPYKFTMAYSANKKTGDLLIPAYYAVELWQEEYGLPILTHIANSFKRDISGPVVHPGLGFSMRDKDEYSGWITDFDVKEILAEDIPLCSVEKATEGARKMIEDGYIQQVLSLRFGYVIYSNPDEEWGKQRSAYDMDTWYLVPSWVMECYILDDPKVDELREYPSITEMTINAQTGEMMDYFDTSLYGRGDARYKGFISWEDVR